MWPWILGALLALLLVSFVLAMLQRLVKLALWIAFAAVLVGGGWWFVREHAPPSVRDGVERAAAEAARTGRDVADRLGREAAAVGAEVVREARERAAAEAERVVGDALGTERPERAEPPDPSAPTASAPTASDATDPPPAAAP